MSDLSVGVKTGRGAIGIAAWAALGVLTGLLIIIGLGAFFGTTLPSTTAVTAAIPVGVAVLCYLAAAASRIRWIGWVAVPLASGLPFLALLYSVTWWLIMIMIGVLITLIGLATARRMTLIQTAAMTGYFGLCVLALFLAPRLGLLVAGSVLALHAGWDVIHFRRNIVVNRSLAVWCIGLDLTVGGICIVLAATA